MITPDRDASVALAGFLCGLSSFIISAPASLSYIGGMFLIFFGSGGAERGLSLGEVVVLLLAAFPVALVGLILSVRGRHSNSRRRLARAGMILSSLALLPFFVALVVLSLTLAYCSMRACL
jgi:hypothetical protein